MPNRSARILICCSLSSPLIYNVTTSFKLASRSAETKLICRCLVHRQPTQYFPKQCRHRVPGSIPHRLVTILFSSALLTSLIETVFNFPQAAEIFPFIFVLLYQFLLQSLLQQKYSIDCRKDIYPTTLHFHIRSSDKKMLTLFYSCGKCKSKKLEQKKMNDRLQSRCLNTQLK